MNTDISLSLSHTHFHQFVLKVGHKLPPIFLSILLVCYFCGCVRLPILRI